MHTAYMYILGLIQICMLYTFCKIEWLILQKCMKARNLETWAIGTIDFRRLEWTSIRFALKICNYDPFAKNLQSLKNDKNEK